MELPAAGTTLGRLIHLIDLGTQDTTYKGIPKKVRKLMLQFELPNIHYTLGDRKGQRMVVGNRFTASMDKKSAFRKLVEDWRAKKFASDDEVDEWWDNKLHMMLDQPGLINITHSDDGSYANVSSVSPLMRDEKGNKQKCPDSEGDLIFFVLVHKYWNPSPADQAGMSAVEQGIIKQCGTMKEVFKKLPEWMREIISKSKEYPQIVAGIKPDDAAQSDAHDDRPDPQDDDEPPF